MCDRVCSDRNTHSKSDETVQKSHLGPPNIEFSCSYRPRKFEIVCVAHVAHNLNFFKLFLESGSLRLDVMLPCHQLIRLNHSEIYQNS